MTKTLTVKLQRDVGDDITVKLEKRSASATIPLRSVTGNDTSIYK